jgi:hypothetical protein
MALTRLGLNQSINLSSNVTGTLATGNGGTGSTATTFVNAATNVTGTLPTANGGTGATSFAAGKVLKHEFFNDGTSTSSNTTSWTATTLTDSIVPSATGSEFLVMGQITKASLPSSASHIYFRWYRDVAGGGFNAIGNNYHVRANDSGGYNGHECFTFMQVDRAGGNTNLSYSAGQTITYKLYFKCQDIIGNSNHERGHMLIQEMGA